MKLGTDEFGKIFLGDDYVERIYQGDDQIYSVYKDPKDSEIVFRPTDNKGQLSVDDPYFGYAKIDCVKGKSLVWNQLTKLRNASTSGTHGLTFTKISDIEFSVNGVCDVAGMIDACQNAFGGYVIGHKLLIKTYIISGTIPTNSWISNGYVESKTKIGQSRIYQPNYKSSELYVSVDHANDEFINAHFTINCIDLTLMFGAGHEPSTVEEFEAMFPLPYYSYNAGTLISNDAETLETVGFNLWDGVTESGYYDTKNGQPVTASNWIRSKNPIMAFPNTDYYVKSGYYFGYLLYYDAEMNYLGSSVGKPTQRDTVHHTPANCSYIHFYAATNWDPSVFCLNLSDPSKNGTYEPYWKSSLSLNLDYLPIKSHNIWDEEWESGSINESGVPVPSTTTIRSKNYISAFGGTAYKITCLSISTAQIVVYFYDANKVWIPYTGDSAYAGGYSGSSGLFTTPAGTAFMLFRSTITYGTTYKYDICINVSDPDFNGQYEPYALRGGLKGAGTVYDLGRVEDDGYIHEVTKVMGEVDLGSLVWSYSSPSFIAALQSASNGNVCVCAKYLHSEATQSLGQNDKTYRISVDGTKNIIIKDSAYTDVTSFKTVMNGVMLYYELATPITYELVTPIKAIYKVDKRGTEQATFPTHSDGSPSAPLCAEIGYPK